MKRYIDIKGRSTRSEYWGFVFIFSLLFIIAMILDIMLGYTDEPTKYFPFITFITILHLIPAFTVGIRRLHDINRSGWFILLNYIPIIGFIILTVLFCKKGDLSVNNYGVSLNSSATSE